MDVHGHQKLNSVP